MSSLRTWARAEWKQKHYVRLSSMPFRTDLQWHSQYCQYMSSQFHSLARQPRPSCNIHSLHKYLLFLSCSRKFPSLADTATSRTDTAPVTQESIATFAIAAKGGMPRHSLGESTAPKPSKVAGVITQGQCCKQVPGLGTQQGHSNVGATFSLTFNRCFLTFLSIRHCARPMVDEAGPVSALQKLSREGERRQTRTQTAMLSAHV